jgi:hypothetical protein
MSLGNEEGEETHKLARVASKALFPFTLQNHSIHMAAQKADTAHTLSNEVDVLALLFSSSLFADFLNTYSIPVRRAQHSA